MPTQYIFMTWWFEKQLQGDRPTPGTDTQPEPGGGWKNWTIDHELAWLVPCVARGDKFVMLGDLREIQLHGKNAGTGKNNCVLGMEVVVLLAAGYTRRQGPFAAADEVVYGGAVLVFDPPAPVHLPQAVIDDAQRKSLRESSGNGGFWTKARYLSYINAIK